MNLNVTPFHFDAIIKRGYSLDLLFIVKLVKEEIDIAAYCEESPKLKALQQAAIRKGLLKDDGSISIDAEALIEFMGKEQEVSFVAEKKAVDDSFDQWWKAYPGTDTFKHKDKTFSGSRSMRVKRDDCKIKLFKILNEGDYTIEELIKALEYEVLQKKVNSYKTGTNKLTFMQNSFTYLNQRSFEPFIELIKEGHTIKEEPVMKGGTDI